MDKAWVWLPRASRKYVEGATNFVTVASRRLGILTELFCPCIGCRNVCHQEVDTVLDHLVIKGVEKKYMRISCWSMHGKRKYDITVCPTLESEAYDLGVDKKYMRISCWSMHGKRKYDITDGPTLESEAYDLVRTAYCSGEGTQPLDNFGGENLDGETALYSTCRN
ncbi:unnamed protein product [Arabidopsis thaliana]|uniref:(thale cress) hypothetical protein n=1 Tax=Arabidopsis thaliana TaxID=3702 RepID=A0A7G2FC38_ARATH|nr:unnamed protein product [Arabidopsis thaliana]